MRRRSFYKDLTGYTTEFLKVIEFSHKDQAGKSCWRVHCRCGKEFVARGNSIVSGNTKSCGCQFRTLIRRRIGRYCGDLGGAKWCAIKWNAKVRGHSLSLTQAEAFELFERQHRRCALSGVELVLDAPTKEGITASLDRIDSGQGYTIDNVQWIHKTVNLMKNQLPEEEFLNWIKLIYQYQQRN